MRTKTITKAVFFSIIFIAIACSNSNSKGKELTVIDVSSLEIDLGKGKVNTKTEYTLQVTNIGDVPFTIYKVLSSCSCTQVEWGRKPVRPGKMSEIKIIYNDKYPGYFHKTLTIYGNTEEPSIIKIKGMLEE